MQYGIYLIDNLCSCARVIFLILSLELRKGYESAIHIRHFDYSHR